MQECTSADGLPYAFGPPIAVGTGTSEIFFVLASSPFAASGIFSWSMADATPAKPVASSMKASMVPPEKVLSVPKAIKFPTKPAPGSSIDYAHGYVLVLSFMYV